MYIYIYILYIYIYIINTDVSLCLRRCSLIIFDNNACLGDHCEKDFDFCAAKPGGMNMNCTALTAAEYLSQHSINSSVVPYICGSCLNGFQIDDGVQKCQGEKSSIRSRF